jgi:hypothetical protein
MKSDLLIMPDNKTKQQEHKLKKKERHRSQKTSFHQINFPLMLSFIPNILTLASARMPFILK